MNKQWQIKNGKWDIFYFFYLDGFSKPRLGHEVGLGSPCQRCAHKCPGFELHFWKKVCQNCRCGKIEHGVLDQTDHGRYWVGKIFDRWNYSKSEDRASSESEVFCFLLSPFPSFPTNDHQLCHYVVVTCYLLLITYLYTHRPLRTQEEEHSFIYGDLDTETEGPVRLDWAPPGSSRLVTKYLQTLGEDNIPIQVYGNFTTLYIAWSLVVTPWTYWLSIMFQITYKHRKSECAGQWGGREEDEAAGEAVPSPWRGARQVSPALTARDW